MQRTRIKKSRTDFFYFFARSHSSECPKHFVPVKQMSAANSHTETFKFQI